MKKYATYIVCFLFIVRILFYVLHSTLGTVNKNPMPVQPIPYIQSTATPTLEIDDEGSQSQSNDEFLEDDDENESNTTVYESGKITYEVPYTWDMEKIDGVTYFFPWTGVFMVQNDTNNYFSNLTSDDDYKLYLNAAKSGIIIASDNYTLIDSDYIDFKGTIALDFVFKNTLDNDVYINRFFIFIYDEEIYFVALSQTDELTDNDSFEKILDSIEFK